MPVYQTNIFICDVCGKVESITKLQSTYYDPVIVPPDRWGYTKNDRFACSNCMEKDNLIKE